MCAGDSYQGDWADGKPQGDGLYEWQDGSWYEGGWQASPAAQIVWLASDSLWLQRVVKQGSQTTRHGPACRVNERCTCTYCWSAQ